MTDENSESTTETNLDVVEFVARLREFTSSGAGVLPGLAPIRKPATITTPTGSISVGSIWGFEVGHVLTIDSGAGEERFVVEAILGDNCRVRPWGGGRDRARWGFRRLLRFLRFRPWRRFE